MSRQAIVPYPARHDRSLIPGLLMLCLALLVLTPQGAPADPVGGCYTLVAGREATADGSVLCGHNEDNGPSDPAGLITAPRRAHGPDAWLTFPQGAHIPQADTTWAYWCLRMPGLDYSDAYLNEHGVTVVSNNCPSREDAPELTDGGVGGPMLRRVVAERARTARQGVHLVGRLIERFGYTASGRTLVICDPREGWLVAMVNGKHWAAQRVPDDQVALLANTYTIRAMDLTDTLRFLACPDLVEYAVARGWHDPNREVFSFEAAYAERERRVSPGNTYRQWSGLRRLAAEELFLPEDDRLPFCVPPEEPLDLSTAMAVLRDHYEDSPCDEPGPQGDAHAQPVTTICNPHTNSSSIFQLHASRPTPLRVVWWLAFWQPCTGVYVPFYPASGMPPPEATLLESATVLDGATFGPEAAEAYAVFGHLARWAAEAYASRAPALRDLWNEIETECLREQHDLEEQCAARAGTGGKRARILLAEHTRAVLDTCLQRAMATVE